MAKVLIGNLRPPIAKTDTLGISKPDGTTIGIDENGTLSSLVKASGLDITDTKGLTGEENSETNTQALIDAIANKVINELVSKNMISTTIEDSDDKVASTSLVYQLNNNLESNATAITKLNSDLNSLSGLFQYTPFCGTFIYDGEATEIITVNEPRITDENWRIIATCQDAGGLAVKQIGNITSGSFRVYFDSEIALTRINYFAFYQA